jgi:predicted AAA+ superfamily ATPase
MDRKTVQSYVGLLRDMYLVAVLPGWRPGLGAREAKHPKAYITDTGLLCHLLGADARHVADQDDVRGRAHETFAVMEILKLATWADTDVRAYHYQRDREDVDLVLEDRAGHIAAIEIKSASTLRERDWRWLAKLRDAQGHRFKAGAVVAAVDQTLPLADRIWALPYGALWA